MVRICSLWGIIIVLLACWLPSSASADDFGGWSHFAPVEVTGNSKYKAVFLTPEVYQHVLPNLADLRLVDSSGKQVPYYIQTGVLVRLQSEIIIAGRLTESFQTEEDSYFEYNVTVQNDTDPIGNKLVFTLPTGNFVKYLEVYGSYDGIKWQYLSKDYIYRVDGREKSEVSLGEVRKFRTYRVRLLQNIEKLSLGGMGLISRKDSRDWTRYEQTARLDYEISNQDRQTVITFKNPYKLRIKQVLLDIDENFQRQYSIYNDPKTNYSLQTGEIYNLRFAGVEIVGKFIKFKMPLMADTVIIKIDNRDDRPLIIKDIQADYFVDKLVFLDVGGAPYRLYFGNTKAERPRYELELQRPYIEKEDQDECRLEKAISNVSAQNSALTFREDYLFNGAIVVISLLLIIILVPKLSSSK